MSKALSLIRGITRPRTLIAKRSNYPYRLYAIAVLGAIGASGNTVAIGWHLAAETRSPVLVSLVTASLLVPQMIGGPVGGALADRFERTTILRLGLITTSLITASMLGTVALLPSAAWPLLCLNGLASLISSARSSVRRAMVSESFVSQRLTRGLGVDAVALSLGFIAGPALTGLLIRFVSIEAAFLLVTALYLIATTLVPLGNRTLAVDRSEHSAVSEDLVSRTNLLQGFAWAWKNGSIRTILLITFVAEFFAFNFVSLAPIVTVTTLAGGAALLGLLRTGFAFGEFAGNGAAVVLGNRLPRIAAYFFGTAVVLQAVGIFLGASSTVVPIILLFAMLGVFGAQFEILQSRLLVEFTPASARARAFGIQQTVWGAGALGALSSGVIASALTPRISLVAMATVGLLITLVIWRYGRRALDPEGA